MNKENYEKMLLEEQEKAQAIREKEMKKKMDTLNLYHKKYYDGEGSIEDYPHRGYNPENDKMTSYKHIYEDVSEDEVSDLYRLVETNKYKNRNNKFGSTEVFTSGTTIIGYMIVIIGTILGLSSIYGAGLFVIIGSLLFGAMFLALGRIVSVVNELIRFNNMQK